MYNIYFTYKYASKCFTFQHVLYILWVILTYRRRNYFFNLLESDEPLI